MNQNKTFLLMLMLSAAMVTYGQTDSTKVTNDSVTWNQSLDGVTVTAQRQLIKQDIDRIGYDVQVRRTGRRGLADRERARHAAQSADGDH